MARARSSASSWWRATNSPRKFTGWLAYTLSRAERRDSGSTEDRLFDFDQTHILTAVASYLLPRNWQIGGRYRLVTGNPRTPVVGAVYNSSHRSLRPGLRRGQHRAQSRCFISWTCASTNAGSTNAGSSASTWTSRTSTTARTPKALQYNYNFRQSKPQQGLPILTILGLRAEF